MSTPRVSLTLSRGAHADVDSALSREWLVTNGLGGFAAGTVAQANTRRYHGLLVAALRPPLDRVVMVAKVDAVVDVAGQRIALGCNEFADGAIDPHGYRQLLRFGLEDGVPVWTYLLNGVQLQQRIWMAQERNTSYVRWTCLGGREAVRLELTPLCTYRDYHAETHGGWLPQLEPAERVCRVTAGDGARPYDLRVDRGSFDLAPDWYWRFRHRVEAERGLDATEDLFRPGNFSVILAPGESVTLTMSAESETPEPAEASWARRGTAVAQLLRSVPAEAPWWVKQLTLAADQFLVRRGAVGSEGRGTTVIAGYPWFGDWGRDTMIALPGLTLATGRLDDAAAILRTFAAHVNEGMLPNRFPDGNGPAEYNTADATLWFFHAIHAYLEARADTALLRELYPVLRDIVDWHERGTRFGIQVDSRDGLLRSGEPGVQLTWMDAKIGDWVVTPRTGKAVEINALWHLALRRMAQWAAQLGDRRRAAAYSTAAERVQQSFRDAFWNPSLGCLYDVVDGPEGEMMAPGRRADPTLRPNQLFAVSLGESLLTPDMQRAVVDCCARTLLTPVGLRSLAAGDPRYVHRYQGGPAQRDAAYHQGTVWSWLTGPFVLAHFRVHRQADYGLELLAGMATHLLDAGIGTISEIFDADAPHAARGCVAQAWSVAETLRAWSTLSASRVCQVQQQVIHA
jgi:predicted glycogen debranching enzyme